jgi:hypothetical protein
VIRDPPGVALLEVLRQDPPFDDLLRCPVEWLPRGIAHGDDAGCGEQEGVTSGTP